MYKQLCISILLAISTTINGVGFLKGTPVLTMSGYKYIEDLNAGDKVIGFDETGKCVEQEITHTHIFKTGFLRRIVMDHVVLFCDADQKFYFPDYESWSQIVCNDDVLLRHCYESVVVDDTDIIPADVEVYDLTVIPNHNFCVSRKDVHVHNFAPFVGLAWTIGEGIAWTLGGTIGGVVIKKTFDQAMASARNRADYYREYLADLDREREQKDAYIYQNNANPPGGGSGNNNKNQPPQPPKPPHNNNKKQNPDDRPDKELNNENKSLEKQSNKHKEKIKSYESSPDSNDNKGYLRDAGQDEARRSDIINRRIKKLKDEVKAFDDRIAHNKRELLNRELRKQDLHLVD